MNSSKVRKSFNFKNNIFRIRLRNFSSDEEAKFRLYTSLKMTLIPVLSFLLMAAFIWIFLIINFYFFKANEFRGILAFEEIFFDFIMESLVGLLPYAAVLLVFVNISALYVSDLLLRPFRLIGHYCNGRTVGEDVSYNPDFFSDLKLLSQFSEFFFLYIETAEKNQQLQKVVVPKKYTHIRRPVFEAAFFFHYFLYILGSMLVVSIALFALGTGLHENIIHLAEQTLPNSKQINFFLNEQRVVIEQIIVIVLLLTVAMFITLAGHLYYKVATPAFAVFATMRSYLKGNYSQRVHLIGYSYLRDQTRKLNKYLDYVQRELVVQEEDNKK